MRTREALVAAAEKLAVSGIGDARMEAEVLLRHALGIGRAEFFANLDRRVETTEQDLLFQLLQRRMTGEPLAYILGHREFFGLDLAVTPDVLIPRQETESLVEQALKFCSADRFKERVDIADVGTGSGAVAVAIAHNLTQATLYATDNSAEALAVADVNRRRHGLTGRLQLLHGDLLEPLPHPVDLIVSNPPYLETGEIPNLAPEVRREPVNALDGGLDGLGVTGRLLRQAPAYLRPGGCAMVEIAPERLEPVADLACLLMPDAQAYFIQDLLGLPRVLRVETRRGQGPGEHGQSPRVRHGPREMLGRLETRHEAYLE